MCLDSHKEECIGFGYGSKNMWTLSVGMCGGYLFLTLGQIFIANFKQIDVVCVQNVLSSLLMTRGN